MKTVINNMIEADYLSLEDEERFDAIETIFDYVYKQIAINEPPNLIPPVSLLRLKTDIWFTATNDTGVSLCRQQYDNMSAYAVELLKYVGVGSFTPVAIDAGYSVGLLLVDVVDDILSMSVDKDSFLGSDEEYETDLPSPENYCILLSQVLAKIVTDNVQAHGALMLYFHSQFVRLGLIEPLRLID